MHRIILFVGLLAAGSAASAQSQILERGYAPNEVDRQLLPSALASYSSSDDAVRSSITPPERIDLVGRNADPPVLRRPTLALSRSRSAGEAQDRPSYMPVLYSMLLPGSGELALGHWVRGTFMMAVEVASWTGYLNFHSEGLDLRDDYEAFADRNWDQTLWISQHEHVYNTGAEAYVTTPAQMDSIGNIYSGAGVWPGFIPWVSKADDKQHYYENIGKYDWYISGWRDYNPAAAPEDRRDTDLRDEYRDMRIESNHKLKVANRFIYLSLLARVFSMLQTTYLIRQSAHADETALLNNRFELRAGARGFGGGEVALEYHFK